MQRLQQSHNADQRMYRYTWASSALSRRGRPGRGLFEIPASTLNASSCSCTSHSSDSLYAKFCGCPPAPECWELLRAIYQLVVVDTVLDIALNLHSTDIRVIQPPVPALDKIRAQQIEPAEDGRT